MLKGKNALVTGSTSGIGRCLARTLARHGANVMLNGVGDDAEAETQRACLAGEFGTCVGYSPADLRDLAQIETLIAYTNDTLGGIDILINNAGIQYVSPIESFPVDSWNDIIAIHLSAAFHTVRMVTPQLRQKGWGRIINMGSAHALIASPFKSAYVAAKHGLIGFTKSVALELAKTDITVNAICPGYVLTPLVEKQIPATMQARNMSEEQVVRDVMLAAQPTKRFITEQEVADYAIFLCSDSARSITGAALTMDGGWTAQ